MKYVFHGAEPTLHPVLGRIEPGLNEHPDEGEVRKLLAAGAITGQFGPAGPAAAPASSSSAAADPPSGPAVDDVGAGPGTARGRRDRKE
jgi:hypothetical protein